MLTATIDQELLTFYREFSKINGVNWFNYFLFSIPQNNDHETKRLSNSSSESSADFNQEGQQAGEKPISEKKTQQRQHEKSLKNTFGWARVDVLTMVIVCTFMTSLCFSIVVEVIQTLFHIDHNDHKSHKDDFHAYPNEIIIILGALGLVLNGISYLLIGGFTFHQVCCLTVTKWTENVIIWFNFRAAFCNSPQTATFTF